MKPEEGNNSVAKLSGTRKIPSTEIMDSSRKIAAFLLAVFLFCMASTGVPPQDIKDGFYEVTDDAKAQLITDISGNRRRVGQELSLTNRVAEIVSISNWNDQFRLGIGVRRNNGAESAPLKGVPKFLVYPQNGRGWSILLAVGGDVFPLELLPSDAEGVWGCVCLD